MDMRSGFLDGDFLRSNADQSGNGSKNPKKLSENGKSEV